MPVEDYLKKLLSNASLRDIISQHFFRATPTFFALSYFALYLDYFYPLGGVGQLSESLKNKCCELGVSLKSNTKVVRLNAHEKLVEDNSGNQYSYGDLIWAGDLKTLYKICATSGLSSQEKDNFEQKKSSIMSSKGGESVFSVYLEVDLPLAYFKNIANGHIFYTPSPQGIGDFSRVALKKLLSRGDQLAKDEAMMWWRDFLKHNTYEISIPGLKDSALVPEGKTGVAISFLADHEMFRLAREGGWSNELKSYIEDELVGIISDSIFPALQDKVLKKFSFTPLNIASRVGSSEGAIVGWSFESEVPVENQIHKSANSVLTPLAHVYQAGQWAYSPAGVPMSILTGKLAADKVLKN